MDWTMIGSVGEVLGAVAVIGSVLYLARQIRSSTLENQRSRYDQALEASTSWSQSIALDAGLGGIVLRGWKEGTAALSEDEQFRFYLSMLALFRAYERISLYATEGGVHGWGKESFERTFRDLMAMPGVREWWQARRHWFAPSMRIEMDAMIADAGPSLLETYRVGTPSFTRMEPDPGAS
jgi:hypothetical protein